MKRAEKLDAFTAEERAAIREARLATLPGDEPVMLARPGGEKDVTLFTAAGPVRFLEGRACVPLAVARELAGPGWSIEGARLP